LDEGKQPAYEKEIDDSPLNIPKMGLPYQQGGNHDSLVQKKLRK